MPLESRQPISKILAPVAIALLTLVVSPWLAELVGGAFMRAPLNQGDLDVYVRNERVYLAVLTATTCLVVGGFSWLFTHLEGSRRSLLATHLRQCAIVYVYLAINLGSAIYDQLFGNSFVCFACPPPWQFIAPAALVANLAVHIPPRTAGGLTSA